MSEVTPLTTCHTNHVASHLMAFQSDHSKSYAAGIELSSGSCILVLNIELVYPLLMQEGIRETKRQVN